MSRPLLWASISRLGVGLGLAHSMLHLALRARAPPGGRRSPLRFALDDNHNVLGGFLQLAWRRAPGRERTIVAAPRACARTPVIAAAAAAAAVVVVVVVVVSVAAGAGRSIARRTG